jgi:hypothetical protein
MMDSRGVGAWGVKPDSTASSHGSAETRVAAVNPPNGSIISDMPSALLLRTCLLRLKRISNALMRVIMFELFLEEGESHFTYALV